MEFGKINNLIYIILPIVLIFVLVMYRKKKERIYAEINIKRNISLKKTGGFLILLGSISLVIALLSPRELDKIRDREVAQKSVYVLFDISKSMLAEDVYPTRLERARIVLETVSEEFRGDRIGLIPFSSQAFIQLPLTADYDTFKNYLNILDEDFVNSVVSSGTNILAGLVEANKSFDRIKSERRVVVLVSDGGEELSEELFEYVKENEIQVFVLGIGSVEGSVIPRYQNGIKTGFIKDTLGNTVVSKVNEKGLKELAEASGGGYQRIDNLVDDSESMIKNIMNIGGNESREGKVKLYKYYFQIFCGLALLLIGAGYYLMEVRENEK